MTELAQDDVLGQFVHGLLQGIETRAQLLTQRGFLLPSLRLARVHGQQIEQLADDRRGNLEVGGEVGQILVELGGEGQELVTMVFQQGADRTEAMRTECFAGLQFGEDEIVESTTVGVGKS